MCFITFMRILLLCNCYDCFGKGISREKYNATVGYIAHITILLSHYSGANVPFKLCLRGVNSFAMMHGETAVNL